MKTTLHDIADKTGLSISTISRVLRGESKTNSKNVEIVIQAAQELNYQINSRLLNTVYNYKKNIHVALVSSIHEGEFYASFFYGLDTASKEKDITFGLYNIPETVDHVIDLVRQLSNNHFDAAILFLPSLQEQDYFKILKEAPNDFIIISAASLFHPVLDTVTFDSYRGGFITASHFNKLGYDNVGLITGPVHRHEALVRKGGFTDYISHHSEMTLVWQFEGDYSFESGQEAYHSFKETNPRPRAIFSSNDYMALGFIEEALKDGVDVPRDVAISGYDNLPICDIIRPKLSSIKTDFTKLGITIFNLIQEKIDKKEGHLGVSIVVPVELDEKETTKI